VCERRFFTLILLLAMLHNMGISLFRFNGSLCRNENIASTGGAFLFLVLLLLGGFLLAKNDIPPWWKSFGDICLLYCSSPFQAPII
jgi:ABC-type multidrug transport system permease subunit